MERFKKRFAKKTTLMKHLRLFYHTEIEVIKELITIPFGVSDYEAFLQDRAESLIFKYIKYDDNYNAFLDLPCSFNLNDLIDNA